MKTFLILSSFLLVPAVASAQGLENVLGVFSNLINLAIPLVIALAVLGFFWGLMKYIFSQGDDEKKVDGKNMMIWGIIALFVMVSVWGLIRMLQDTFNIQTGTPIIPTEIRR